MGRSERPLLLILGALFLAMAGWMGLSAWETLSDPIHTTLAVPMTVEETVELQGIVLREESIIETRLPCCTLFAHAGERYAAGAVLGAAGVDAAALRAARQLQESRQLLSLSETGEAEAVYAAAIARGDMATAGAALATLAHDPAAETMLEADSALLEYRLAGRTELLRAEKSGIFFPWVDGYEHLSPACLTDLSPEVLTALLAETPQPVSGACGRMVTGNYWYYAAWAPAEETAALTEGTEVFLSPAGGSLPVWATVCSVSEPEDGRRAIVLRCSASLAEIAGCRFLTATVVKERFQGLQLPAGALHRDERGTFVYLSAGLTARRVDVELLYDNNGSVLVTGDGLYPGSEILLGGSQLYDGRLLT